MYAMHDASLYVNLRHEYNINHVRASLSAVSLKILVIIIYLEYATSNPLPISTNHVTLSQW